MAHSPTNFKSILNQVCNLAGIDTDTLPTTEWRLIRDLVSRRIRFGWEAAKWPETCVTEKRTVTQSGGEEGDFVSLSQVSETPIGEVFAVYNKSPKQNTDTQTYDWHISENGVQLSKPGQEVFVFFRKVAPEFAGELYSQDKSYNENDHVYDNSHGNFYIANQSVASGSNNSPFAQPSYWDLVNVPSIFTDYLIRGAYADYLRHNGELDRARVAESDARGALDHELLKLHTQQGQTTRLQVSTY